MAVCYTPPHKSRRAGRGSEGVRPTKSQLAVYNVKIKKKANKREREEFFFLFFELYQVVSARRYTIGTEKFWVLERGGSRGFIPFPVVEGGKKRLNKKVDGSKKTNDPEGLCIYKRGFTSLTCCCLLAVLCVCVAMPYAYLVNAFLI